MTLTHESEPAMPWPEVEATRMYWPSTASHTRRYSSSGSMIQNSTPFSRLRSAMSFTK